MSSFNQCFGSGSETLVKSRHTSSSCGPVVKWLPYIDPDPYWEYGPGSGSKTVKMVSEKEKNLRHQV